MGVQQATSDYRRGSEGTFEHDESRVGVKGRWLLISVAGNVHLEDLRWHSTNKTPNCCSSVLDFTIDFVASHVYGTKKMLSSKLLCSVLEGGLCFGNAADTSCSVSVRVDGGTWQAAGTSERFLPENWCPNLSDLRSSLPWKTPGPQRNIDATCHESGGFFVKWPQHPSRSSPKLAPALGSRHVAKLPWASTWHYNCWNLRALTDNPLGVQQPTPKPNSFQI